MIKGSENSDMSIGTAEKIPNTAKYKLRIVDADVKESPVRELMLTENALYGVRCYRCHALYDALPVGTMYAMEPKFKGDIRFILRIKRPVQYSFDEMEEVVIMPDERFVRRALRRGREKVST